MAKYPGSNRDIGSRNRVTQRYNRPSSNGRTPKISKNICNEYSCDVEFGEPYNVGRSKKHVNVSLRKNEDNT